MSELAAALTAAMRGGTSDLVVFDREASAWHRHPWPEVHGLAESVAAWLLDRGRPPPWDWSANRPSSSSPPFRARG